MKNITLNILYPIIVGIVLFYLGRYYQVSDDVITLETSQIIDRPIVSTPDSLTGKVNLVIDGELTPEACVNQISLYNESGKTISNIEIEFEFPKTFKGKVLATKFIPPSDVMESVVEKVSDNKYKIKSFNPLISNKGYGINPYVFSIVTNMPIKDKVNVRAGAQGIKVGAYEYGKFNLTTAAVVIGLSTFLLIIIYVAFLIRLFRLGKKRWRDSVRYMANKLKLRFNLSNDESDIESAIKSINEDYNKSQSATTFIKYIITGK